jgi:hypothetical protein
MRRFLVVLLAIVTLSGCGGGVDGSLFATAVSNTKAAGGAEAVFQWNYDVPGTDQPVVMTGNGIEDASGENARVVAVPPGDDQEIECIVHGDVIYLSSVLFGDPGGKEWVRLDLERAYESLDIEVGSLGQVGQGTQAQLDALAQVSEGVTDEGREEVRGVESTHYSAMVDLNKLPGKNIDKLVKISGDPTIAVDVWIDDDQRIRRMEWEETLPNGLGMTMIMEYVRFGVPVTIDTPDDADVFDATDLAVQEIEQALD